MKLDLLLVRADDHRPVLPQGLSAEVLQRAPHPGALSLPKRLWDGGHDPNHLPTQRWGLVAPEGPEGDRLLGLIDRLTQARQAQQEGAPVRVYRVPPAQDERTAVLWRNQTFLDEQVPEAERPRYLLLLGDLGQVSLELQQVLALDAFVGRLTFPTDEGYMAYVSKVLRWETAPAKTPRPRLLFYTAKDGTDATAQGHRMLIEPVLASCQKRQRDGAFPSSEILELTDENREPGESLLAHVAEPTPSCLFTLSHGLGQASSSPSVQRAQQGALVLPGNRTLKTADVASRAFLPGGVWFFLACFSAGTPARSTYLPWLQQLRGTSPGVDHALACLPRQDQHPFIAAQPQAALANPEGPLAVVGHVDLAWTYSFNDQGVPRPSRFFGVLRQLAEQRRVGVALHELLRFARDAGNELALLYKQEEVAREAGQQCDVHPVERASAWMRRQDLSSYVLLGDPAVRLPRTTT